jgi:CheY-like chemotaxis protein
MYASYAGTPTVMKVMIVDDNAEMRDLIRTLLGGVATDFVECSDGRQAVESYEKERPDWAVMDVAMGTMDGLTATRLIKARFPGSHIMVITHHNHPKLRESAQEAGAEGFLLKEDLLELRTLLTVGPEHEGKAPDNIV